MSGHERVEQHSLTWADLSELLKRHRWVILTVFATVVVACWVTLQVGFTDEYETQASLLVRIGRENAEVPTTVQNGQLLSQGVRVADINSEVQMLSSREHVEAVVDQFGVDKFKNVLPVPDSLLGYPKYYLKMTARWVKSQWKEFLIAVSLKKRLSPREEAVLFVAKGLKVEPVKESDVLVMKLRLPSAKLAVEVANAILVHYFARRSEIRQASAGADFFSEELDHRKKKLDDLGGFRASVRERFQLSSPGEQRTNLLKQLSEIETEIHDTNAEISRLEKQREVIRTERNSYPELLQKERVSAQNPSILSLKERITSLKLERAKVLNRYQPESEVIQKVDREIAELEMILSKEDATVVATVTSEANPVLKELSRQLSEHDFKVAGIIKQRDRLVESAAQINTQLERMNVGSDAYERADREYHLAEQFYMLYVKKLQDAQLSEELNQRRLANVSIISQPEMPMEPVYPPKLFVMGVALPVGLILGVVFGALRESMEDRITSQRDLESIANLEFLGGYKFCDPVSSVSGKESTSLFVGGRGRT